MVLSLLFLRKRDRQAARLPASALELWAPTEQVQRFVPIAHPASMGQVVSCVLVLTREGADRQAVVTLPVRSEPQKDSQPEPSADRVLPPASRVAYQARA